MERCFVREFLLRQFLLSQVQSLSNYYILSHAILLALVFQRGDDLKLAVN